MKIAGWLVAVTSLAVFGGGAYLAGANGVGQQYIRFLPSASPAEAQQSIDPGAGEIIYYRHPDGVAEYAKEAKKTSDGRDYVPIRQTADISFDAKGVVAAKDRATSPSSVTSMTAGPRKVLFYRNPMGLPDTSKVPKKDSMGMDYIPVFEGDQDDTSTVKVTLGKLQRTGIRTALADVAPISRRVRVPGTVSWDERLVSVVAMRTDTFIDDVADVTTGDQIREGQKLFSFYSQEIATAGAEFASGRGGGRTSDAGSALRLRNLGLPQEAIDRIASKGQVPPSIDLVSPRAGVVIERMATAGMMAKPGDILFKIADPAKVWIIADISEHDLASISVGLRATVSVRGFPGRAFFGEVDLIYPEIEPQTRTTKVRIEIANPDGILRANMYADVQIEEGASEPVLGVPTSAVIDTGERQVVFIDRGEGRFEPRNVSVGVRGEDRTEIRDGVSAGDKVVVAANFLLDAESNLNSALGAMSGEESQ